MPFVPTGNTVKSPCSQTQPAPSQAETPPTKPCSQWGVFNKVLLQLYPQIKAWTVVGGRCEITANTLHPFEEAAEVSPVILPISCQARVAESLLCTDTIMANCYSRAAHKTAHEDARKKDRTNGIRKLGSILCHTIYIPTHKCLYTPGNICAALGEL